MNEEELKKVREYLINEYFRDDQFMFLDNQKNSADVIASLYDMLHFSITGEHYDYMWHWANKVGGWYDDLFLYKILEIGDIKKDEET